MDQGVIWFIWSSKLFSLKARASQALPGGEVVHRSALARASSASWRFCAARRSNSSWPILMEVACGCFQNMQIDIYIYMKIMSVKTSIYIYIKVKYGTKKTFMSTVRWKLANCYSHSYFHPHTNHHYYLTIASFVLGGSMMIQPTSPEIHPKNSGGFNGSKTSRPTHVQPLQSHRVVQCHWCVESTPVQLEALVKFGTKTPWG